MKFVTLISFSYNTVAVSDLAHLDLPLDEPSAPRNAAQASRRGIEYLPVGKVCGYEVRVGNFAWPTNFRWLSGT